MTCFFLLKSSNKGIAIDEDILLYAVDIVLIAKNEENLQVMLKVLYNWSMKKKVMLFT